MNDIICDTPKLTETTSRNQPTQATDDDAGLEQQMADLGLSNDTRRFLRHLHHAEMQINDAFRKSRQGGGLRERVGQVYGELYGRGCMVRNPRQQG